jgi:hypothetical protein
LWPYGIRSQTWDEALSKGACGTFVAECPKRAKRVRTCDVPAFGTSHRIPYGLPILLDPARGLFRLWFVRLPANTAVGKNIEEKCLFNQFEFGCNPYCFRGVLCSKFCIN